MAAGMAAWERELREGRRARPVEVGDTLMLRHDREPPAGTFHREPGVREPLAVITYNPDRIERPMTLVATFAHELGHLLLSATLGPPPAAPIWRNWRPTSPPCSLASACSRRTARFRRQFQDSGTQGWASQRLGYLSEPALLVALAIFQGLNGGAADDAARWLKPGLRKPYLSTAKAVARRYPDSPAAVGAADPAAFG